MLVDKKQFDIVEEWLRKNGHVDQFEKECGPVKGRVMITLTEIPEGIELVEAREEAPVAFEASFDFYDAALGIAIYTEDKTPATDLWISMQKDDAEEPAQDWVEFFIKTLVSHISEDGSYGVPIYSLVNDIADLTIVPDDPNAGDELSDES